MSEFQDKILAAARKRVEHEEEERAAQKLREEQERAYEKRRIEDLISSKLEDICAGITAAIESGQQAYSIDLSEISGKHALITASLNSVAHVPGGEWRFNSMHHSIELDSVKRHSILTK